MRPSPRRCLAVPRSISSAVCRQARSRSPSTSAISARYSAPEDESPLTSRTWLDRASASGHASSARPSIASSVARPKSVAPGGQTSAYLFERAQCLVGRPRTRISAKSSPAVSRGSHPRAANSGAPARRLGRPRRSASGSSRNRQGLARTGRAAEGRRAPLRAEARCDRATPDPRGRPYDRRRGSAQRAPLWRERAWHPSGRSPPRRAWQPHRLPQRPRGHRHRSCTTLPRARAQGRACAGAGVRRPATEARAQCGHPGGRPHACRRRRAGARPGPRRPDRLARALPGSGTACSRW